MILVGRNLSPFVRRTALVLKSLGVAYDVSPLSTADQMEEISKLNPVGRVPCLILDDGEAIVDSAAIIDHLLEAHDPDHKLLPASGAERRDVLRLTSIATGAMEKTVASSYERNRRPAEKVHQPWVDQVDGQAASGMAALDAAAAKSSSGWLHGDSVTLADISAVAAYDFMANRVSYQLERASFPALAALSARCGEQAAFSETHPG